MSKNKRGNSELALINNFDNEIYGMSRNFARAELWDSELKGWSNIQSKIFTEILSKINWKGGGNSNVIEFDNDEFMRDIQWELSQDEIRKLGHSIRTELDYMLKNCAITVQDPYSKRFYEGHVIVGFEGTAQRTTVTINPVLLPHFEKLYSMTQTTGVSFLPFIKEEVMKFKSKFSYPLLMELKSCCQVGGATNYHTLTTRQLKDMFNLPIGAYMRSFDKKTGTYKNLDRRNMEKNTLDRAIPELNETNMISILPWEDGKFYRKVKKGREVTGYEFMYKVYDLDQMKERKLRERQELDVNKLDIIDEPAVITNDLDLSKYF